jgi:membrane protein implicated in regulation of membrane protease activity
VSLGPQYSPARDEYAGVQICGQFREDQIMTTIFLFCAVVGGTVLACQFVLTLLGLGQHDVDMSHDVPHDLSADGAHHASFSDGDGHDAGHHHGSTWLFGVISFRTLVAAFTFFGLAGMAAQSAELALPWQLLIAVIAGTGAMYGVHWIMQTFYRLGEDGTARITRAVGQQGTVYVSIPGGQAGSGKIQLNLQNRLVEYEAVTSAEAKLPAGAKVVVVGVMGSSTLVVEPQHENVAAAKA